MAVRDFLQARGLRRSSWKLRLFTVSAIWLFLAGLFLFLAFSDKRSAEEALSQQAALSQSTLRALLLGDQLMDGSDLLTSAFVGFIGTESPAYASSFFHELDVEQTREKALLALQSENLSQEALAPILRAKKLSDALLKEELQMLRMLYPLYDIPLVPRLEALTPAPHLANLSPEAQRSLARNFVYGTHYRSLKDEIRAEIELFKSRQSEQVRAQFAHTLTQTEAMMQRQMMVNVFSLLWPLLLLLLLYHLLVRPVADYSRFLNQQSAPGGNYAPLQLHGSHELRSLGLAFNNVLLQLQDAKERLVLQNQELTVLSTTDHLTKVLNRLAMENYMNNLLASWEPSIPLSVIMLDLDYFKVFNDAHGHPAGDEALKSVAQLIDEASQMQLGLAARMGGEEFFILLPGMSEEELDAFAEDILQRVRRLPIKLDEAQHSHLSVSLGSYTARDELQSPKELYSRADKALYHAKQSGRDCHVSFRNLEEAKKTDPS